MDYRELLRLYMKGVIDVEGVSFIGEAEVTPEQHAALVEIQNEIYPQDGLESKLFH